MDPTSSVSKGVFVFKNNMKLNLEDRKKMQKKPSENENIYSSELWYNSYKHLWKKIETKIKQLNNEMFSKILYSLLQFVKDCYNETVTEIPTATILMGINMPDHGSQLTTLCEVMQNTITPHVAMLLPEDCNNIKNLVENMISQFINDEDDDSDLETNSAPMKKSLCNFSLLSSWYKEKYFSPSKSTIKKQEPGENKKSLVVIIPEFESFEESVLKDFILIISSYINVLPFIIIFGVATSLATIHKTLPYQVTSKMKIQVFSSQSSKDYLNNILNKVLLCESCPFRVGGKTFTLFSDIFLFYDFSVKGFIQNFKFAMLEHYSYGNAMSLCTNSNYIDKILSNFNHDDYENVRKLMSFRTFVESKDFATRINLITEDRCLKQELKICLKDLQEYIICFNALLKCLLELVFDLPGAPLGKQFREIYAIAMTENIVETIEYKQCVQLLNFLSRDQLVTKYEKLSDILSSSLYFGYNTLKFAHYVLGNLKSELNDFNIEVQEDIDQQPKTLTENLNRTTMREELLKMSKTKSQTKYEQIRENQMRILTDFFSKYLILPTSKPFHEIFIFNNANSIKSHIVGSHRAAIHAALNNPQCYLQCDCCKLPNDSTILPTLPDISIVYKLHLETSKFINMYDWLQAFVTIVDPTDHDDEEERNIDPKLQARFTRAVAELEFLGFIKSSKRKTDHAQRLTWGGC